ncbi:MAG: hypothetical protein JSS18_01245 [Proteobacteria bacterium]|nr:hypothetical protein [Pseudomonadota bacterium]
MQPVQRITAAEAQVLEATLPQGLTEPMREVALCLFEALALQDGRAGSKHPNDDWRSALQRLAQQVLAQLAHMAATLGGGAIYLAKGIAVHLSARDREMCAQFRGNNYAQLARAYGLTEMRVRQIVDAYQREAFLRRQHVLPGLETADIS